MSGTNQYAYEWKVLESALEGQRLTIKYWEDKLEFLARKIEKLNTKDDPRSRVRIAILEEEIETINHLLAQAK